MELARDLVEGRFVKRLNRFAAMVELDGREVMVHVANSGRLEELLVPGYRMLLKPVPGDHRKCKYDLALVDVGSALVSADARLPNALLAEALAQDKVPEFQGFTSVRREVVFGESRLDLLLDGPDGSCYVEAKSVTLVVDGVAWFPDAPTARGVKHLNHLAQAVGLGHRAAVVFVIQREDARSLSPYDANDPEFGATLRRSVAAGVEAYAYRCRVTEAELTLADRVPVEF